MSEETTNIDTILEKADLEYMLEFETQIFLDIVHNDGLVVAAKGLSLDLVVMNLLKVYCDPGNLVLVLNCNELEEQYFIDKLKDSNVHSIKSSSSDIVERQDLYLSGGIHFVTTRILVMDMLKRRIPIDKITGIVVLKAHTIFESCQEAFVLRLFRQHNKTGFIKAFSNNALSFTIGFGQVERVMRALFVKELYIWPRFHSTVIQSLKKHEPQVIELHIPISQNIRKMQTYILELMNLTVKEIKKINKTVELQEITVENCLTKKFHKILQSQLDVIWHQLSSKSRQLVADLKTLRHLIITLLYSDPVTFYSVLAQYRTKDYALTATWVLFQPAEMLFTSVNSLVFTGDKEFNPEFCPKWEALLEILKIEIPSDIRKCKTKDHVILILCSDQKTCHQLSVLLTQGPHFYLFLKALQKKIPFKSISDKFKSHSKLVKMAQEQQSAEKKDTTMTKTRKKAKNSNEKKVKETETDDKMKDEPENEEDIEDCFKSSYLLTMSQSVYDSRDETVYDDSVEKNDTNVEFEPFTEMENLDLTQISEKMSTPTILIQTFKCSEKYANLQRLLHDLKPSYIIMYQSDMTAIREIEMYEAHRKKETRLKVFFLIHAETVEEQSYLTTLRKEKEAFEHLIERKSTMVVPEDQDGKSDECLALQRDLDTPTKNTRQGGKADETVTKQTVIVDMREFRSELPSLIHKRGMDIEPLTITIGDYVLTPDICVERKSLSDLIGSLLHGRLYQQCTQMSRYYTTPMLLIEFDKNKPFSWKNHYMLSSDSNNFEMQQKLLLLTLHFPKLKIIWSPSAYATAQLFEELKQGKKEPSVEYALATGGEQDMDMIEAKYNSNIYDFVQKLPGITSKNIDAFLKKVKSLDEAIKLSEDELKEILGNSADAKTFYSFLHGEHTPKEEGNQQKQKGNAKSRFKCYNKKK